MRPWADEGRYRGVNKDLHLYCELMGPQVIFYATHKWFTRGNRIDTDFYTCKDFDLMDVFTSNVKTCKFYYRLYIRLYHAVHEIEANLLRLLLYIGCYPINRKLKLSRSSRKLGHSLVRLSPPSAFAVSSL